MEHKSRQETKLEAIQILLNRTQRLKVGKKQ